MRAWAEIDIAVLRANINSIRRAVGPQTAVMAVVKADAYGHGIVEVARGALDAGALWLGVATVDEGISLREAGIQSPIALLCAAVPNEASEILHHTLVPMVGDNALLGALIHAAKIRNDAIASPPVHLEIDTGMGRSGVLPEQAVPFWKRATASGLRVTGLATHFADADGPDEALSVDQMDQFRQTRKALEAAGARFEVVHLNNSAATLRFPGDGGNLVRPGVLIYGIRPQMPASILRACPVSPVLALKARVAAVRSLPRGHAISYGATYKLPRDARVATVLIGYGDGYPRRLSNVGSMLLRGKRAPILGRVCMDQTVLDVTEIPDAAPGDIAICIGGEGGENISAEQIAAAIDTTEHEITTAVCS